MASWFSCSRNAARGQHVKLVFPGGHVELLDRPTPAADVMARHPRFCVARPDVFREPAGAVAAPDAVLQLGDKYYVVPCSTVRRLQKHSAAAASREAAAGGRRGGSGAAVPGLQRRQGGDMERGVRRVRQLLPPVPDLGGHHLWLRGLFHPPLSHLLLPPLQHLRGAPVVGARQQGCRDRRLPALKPLRAYKRLPSMVHPLEAPKGGGVASSLCNV